MNKHLKYALIIGFILRLFSAYFVYGPQALDDYLNQIFPALQMDLGLPHDLPSHRSALTVWIMFGWIKIAHLIGIDSVLSLIRWIYLLMGSTSLLGILGVYYYFRDQLDTLEFKLGLYLMAGYGLMPFISTRAFLESFSAGFLTLGMGLLYYGIKSKKDLYNFIGLYLVGFSTLIRLQVGLIYVFIVFFFLFQKNWRLLFQAFAIGVILLISQILIEVFDNRAPMSVLISYFKINENVSQYGVQPWYSTWGTWFLFFYFPFCFAIARGFKRLIDHHLLLGSTLFFILIHSLIPHKEERFLYPIMGLTLIILTIAWSSQWGTKWERWIYRPSFSILNSMLLIVGCFFNTQVGEIGFPAEMQMRSNKVIYFDRDSLVGQGDMYNLFLRKPAELIRLNQSLVISQYENQLQQMDAFVLLTSNPSFKNELQQYSGQNIIGFRCGPTEEKISLTDSLIYKMNPTSNYRRRPTWAVQCWK